MKKKSLEKVSITLNIIFLLFIAIIAIKGNYFTKFWNKITNITKINYQYEERTTLFDSYVTQNTDIVFVGDSITQRCDYNELFGISIANRGVGGDTTEGVLNRIDDIIKLKPKKMFIMIGINDLGKGYRIDDIISNYKKILSEISEKLPNTKIYVQSILPINNSKATEVNINNESVIETNKRLASLCKEFNMEYIDLFTEFVDDNGQLNPKLSGDGVHLMGKGYLIWKDTVAEIINE